MPSSTLKSQTHLQTILDKAKPFLRGDLEKIDPNLPSLVSVLRSVGAGECWHKHGSFLEHLIDIYKILYLWNTPPAVSLCGLFHSAYSNSYVNLAIFDPKTGRETVRNLLGEAAERLVHLFCVVPRQSFIHDDLLFHYSDEELMKHLKESEISLKEARFHQGEVLEEEWRKKIQSLVPPEGVVVKHIKSGENITVSRRVVAIFVMMTMADFSDQITGFQDVLFDNSNGRLEFSGNNPSALWPGDGKPGLWMTSISRMGALYNLIVREEEIYVLQREGEGVLHVNVDRDEDIELVIPPVFENCTRVLDARDQIDARDLYWEAICDGGRDHLGLDRVEELLLKCIEKNPFIGEPHVVLSQAYLTKGRFEEGDGEAEKGLRLLLEWGSPWDKRTSWEGWVAWARVLVMKAKEKSWPNSSWGILNLGLVK